MAARELQPLQPIKFYTYAISGLFRSKPAPPDVIEKTDRIFTLLERHLEGQRFLAAAHPTLADIAIYSYTALVDEGRISLEPYPNLPAWLARVEALPRFVPVRRSRLPELQQAAR